jgi:hypothetical protein
MNINFIYDASVSSAPAGFKTALNTVAQELSQVFADPITINIQVGWGFVNGVALSPTDVGETSVQSLKLGAIGLTYAALKTDLMQHATSIEDVIAINNLPAIDPTGGGLIYVSSAQQKAWGLLPPNSPAIDGAIGFRANPAIWDFNQADGISPGALDFMATAEHEITHVLGRVLGLPQPQFQVPDLLDLFDYSSSGHLAGSVPGYFSIDGGRTPLDNFSTSGDFADWNGLITGIVDDAFNAMAAPGQVNRFTSVDFIEMDGLGFNLNWGVPGLSLASNVALPALTTYQKMYGVSPSSTELWTLKVFDEVQSVYGHSIGLDAVVYMYSALGQALATGSDTGSTAFKSTWGPLTISSDATFVTQAYTNVFATSGTAAQIQHFVDQMNFYKSIYTASGAFGTDANLIDLLARGAIYGQMIGVKAESPTAALAAASAPADISLVGVSAQHDTTHTFI